MRRLIPNTITVSEQFEIRDKITKALLRWSGDRTIKNLSVERIAKECGIHVVLRCQNKIAVLSGFYVIDERVYLWWSLTYM